MPPRPLLRRTLEVGAPPGAAWAHLARVEEWPSWARHIRSVRLEPEGPLGPGSRGVLLLRPCVPAGFAMTDWEPPRRWRWRGRLLWLEVGYDHRFEPLPGGGTRIVLEVEASGPGAAFLGPPFARAYARNLDRALPLLAAELEGLTPRGRP